MLGSVTGNETEARETLSKIKTAGYDGLELNSFMITPTPMMVRMLTKAAGMPTGKGGKLDWKGLVDEAGLSVVSVHENLGTIENDIDKVIAEAKKYETNKIVITGMYRFAYDDIDNMKKLAERLNKCGKELSNEGISLLYHNHNVEFVKLEPGKTSYDFLLDNTDPSYINFEFDSYWPTEAGVDTIALMEKLADRMKLYHITDRGSRASGQVVTPIVKNDCLECGMGNMNLTSMVDIAKKSNVEAIVLESHKNWINNSPVDSLELSAKWLNANV